MSSHEAHESKKVSEELRHHQFGAAHKEISHEMHSHPKEFEHLLKSINHDLAKHNQNPLSVERDSKNHISHINFNNHDIYSGSQSNSSAERHTAGHSGSPAGAGEGHGHHAGRHHGKHHGKHHGHGRHESDESDEQPDSENPKDSGKDPADKSKPDSPDAKKGDEASKQSKNPLQAMADVVKDVAKDLGLNRTATVAAVASMLQESGGDPNKPGDYGKKDHKPHSFGLFQLNFRGGEGTEAGITPKQALNPHTNASIALQYFRKHQHLHDPAQIAALAQRPSDKLYHAHVAAYVPEAERLLGDR